jgi:hypothetical protein
MATAQVAILQIQVIEGEGEIYAPGARGNRPLVVEVTDETGRPVAGAAVSFHMPEEGPSGTFANGLRTEVVTTDEHGRAVLRAMQVNRIAGRFQIRIIASKEQATAGAVSNQYIVEAAGGKPAASKPAVAKKAPAPAVVKQASNTEAADETNNSAAASSRAPAVSRASPAPRRPAKAQGGGHGHKKLLIILAAVGAAAAVAVLATHTIGKQSSSSSAPDNAVVSPTIGTPTTITVGAPAP